jgi:hypothetical protein
MRTLVVLLALLAATGLAGCKQELVCPADERACDGACVAVAADPQNCGACGNACADGLSCSGGQCRCADGRASCGDACVDLASDPLHCGGCDTACDPGQVCTSPAGGAATCAAACAAADQTDCGGACVDLAADRWNCGACGRGCGTGEACTAGRCTAALYVACYNSGELREATATLAPAGLPVPVAAGPIALARLDGELFLASAGPGGVETVARVAMDPPALRSLGVWTSGVSRPDIQFLAAHAGYLYVSHASLGTLLVLSPAGAVVEEHAFVGEGETNPNPLGIAFHGDRAYVALQARDEVAVLDVSAVGACAAPGSCIHELTRIDVSGLAGPDASAMPARIAVAAGAEHPRAFVTLWNLDAFWNPPAGSHGRLAAIDLGTDALDETAGPGGLVDLGAGCLNPGDVAVNGEALYVTCGAFDYSAWPTVTTYAQGIVPVDLAGAAPAVGSILAAPANSAPGDLAFCGGAGYVADRNSGRIFRLDPAVGAVDGAELCPAGENSAAYVPDIACGE